jgi:hypothetical protein
MTRKQTWLEMSNGTRLDAIPFVARIEGGEGNERRYDFEAPNPPIYEGDVNLFSRLSFESIKARFEAWGYSVDHIIRGECTEAGVRDCYVYRPHYHVPFAVIRPRVFER